MVAVAAPAAVGAAAAETAAVAAGLAERLVVAVDPLPFPDIVDDDNWSAALELVSAAAVAAVEFQIGGVGAAQTSWAVPVLGGASDAEAATFRKVTGVLQVIDCRNCPADQGHTWVALVAGGRSSCPVACGGDGCPSGAEALTCEVVHRRLVASYWTEVVDPESAVVGLASWRVAAEPGAQVVVRSFAFGDGAAVHKD